MQREPAILFFLNGNIIVVQGDMRKTSELLRNQILYDFDHGITNAAELARKYNLNKSTTARIIQFYRNCSTKKFFKINQYNWNEVQQYYDIPHSKKECLIRFNIPSSTWNNAAKIKAIRVRNIIPPLNELLRINSSIQSPSIRNRLIREGIFENKCQTPGCSVSNIWMGSPLVLQLDHINGDHSDNRLQNLRLLCPNCHTQTPTWAGRKNNAQFK